MFKCDAFLSGDINIHIVNNRNVEKELFDIYEKLNKLINTVKYEIDADSQDYKSCILLGLLCKSIQSYDAIAILSNFGLQADAIVLLRSLLETAMNFSAIVNDDSYFEHYIMQGDFQTLKLVQTLRKNKDIMTDKLNEHISNSDFSEYEELLKGWKSISFGKLSELANMKELYVYTYNLSSLYAHSNIKSIMSSYLQIEEDSVKSLNINPSYTDQKLVLVTAINIMIAVTKSLATYFSLSMNNEIDELELLLYAYVK